MSDELFNKIREERAKRADLLIGIQKARREEAPDPGVKDTIVNKAYNVVSGALNSAIEAPANLLDFGATMGEAFLRTPGARRLGIVPDTLTPDQRDILIEFASSENPVRKAASAIRSKALPEIPGEEGSILRGLGSGLGMVGQAALMPTAGAGAVLAGTEGAQAMGVGNYNRVLQATGDRDKAFTAFLAGTGVGAAGAIPVQNVLTRMNKATGGTFGDALIDAALFGGIGSGQSAVNDAVLEKATGEDISILKNAAEAGVLGLLTSAVLTGVQHATSVKATEKPQGAPKDEPAVQGEETPSAQPEPAQAVLEPVARPAEPPARGDDMPPDAGLDRFKAPAEAAKAVEAKRKQTETPEFKAWFGESKVVDESGAPQVAYHGTRSSFTSFDIRKAGKSDAGLVGPAFYFSPEPATASMFADRFAFGEGGGSVIPAYLSLKNPYVFTDGVGQDGTRLGNDTFGSKSFADRLKKQGFDGVVFLMDGKPSQYAVFEPTQIKSATGNSGRFDPNNPDIRDTPTPDPVLSRITETTDAELAKPISESNINIPEPVKPYEKAIERGSHEAALVDTDGRNVVLYRGEPSGVENVYRPGDGAAGPGTYFSLFEQVAKTHAGPTGVVHQATVGGRYLRVPPNERINARDWNKYAREHGYDGLLVNGEVVVFDPSKINLPEQPSPPPTIEDASAQPDKAAGVGDSTGIKNATVDDQLRKMGFEPAQHGEPITNEESLNRATETAAKDPQAGSRLVDELSASDRHVTTDEVALLTHEANRRLLESESAEDALAKDPRDPVLLERARLAGEAYRKIADVVTIAGTKQAQAFQLRQMMLKRDYSLAAIERRMTAKNDGIPPNAEEIASLRKTVDELKTAIADHEKAHTESAKRIAELEADRSLRRLKRDIVRSESRAKSERSHVREFISKRADEARARFKQRATTASMNLDPQAILDAAAIGADFISKGVVEVKAWSDAMRAELGDVIAPHLSTLYQQAKDMHDKSANEADAENFVKRASEGKDVSQPLTDMARRLVESGVEDREALVNALHELVSKVDPKVTIEEVRDAFSGYGKFRPLDKDPVKAKVREFKGELQKIAQIEALEAKMAPAKTGFERQKAGAEQQTLLKRVNDLKKQLGLGDQSDASRLQSRKTRAENEIKRLEEMLRTEDFSKPERRPAPSDPALEKSKAKIERLRSDIDRKVREKELAGRSRARIVQDTLIKWRRAFVLSSPSTLAKLTAAGAERMIFTPLEEAIGAGIGKAIPKVAEQAPRQGGISPQAEASALTQGFVKGMKDARDIMKTGASDLDAINDKSHMDLPKSALDFFGHLHAALKATTKRNEFIRSFQKRTEFAIRQGVDVRDPLVQTRIASEAYKDANASIFMQDNIVVDAYKRALSALEAKNKETGNPSPIGEAGATAARVILPIIKVPTNVVAETFAYVFGGLHGTAELANAYRKGIDTLQPHEADAIMRHLKKGSLGAAVLALGYFGAGSIGGYYSRDKRDPNDPKFGSIRVFGVNVPSLLIHNPLLEVLQVGATMRRVADSMHKGERKGIADGAIAAAMGVAEQVPFVRETMDTSKALDAVKQGQGSDALGGVAGDMVAPGGLSWLARQFDKDSSGETVKRKPRGFVQTVEAGIPFLRNTLPTK